MMKEVIDYNAQAEALINNLDNRLSPSAYDTAWMARVRNADDSPRYPELLDWLLENQHDDGSWGGKIPYRHDRLLSTYAAMIALADYDIDKQYPEVIKRAERYVWQNMHLLHNDLMDLAGYEILLPTMIQDAHKLGLRVPSHSYGYAEMRDAKLSKIPMNMMANPAISLANSMEYLRGKDVLDILNQVQGDSGAIANSPSTTSFLAMMSDGQNQAALDWLDMIAERPYGIPDFHPWTNFEVSWVMEHLSYSGISLADFAGMPVWETLLNNLTPQGISIHPTYLIKDGDTTSVTMHVLRAAGYDVPYESLKYWEHPEKHTILTFYFERNMSVITNVHALEALMHMPDYPERDQVWNSIIRSILSLQKYRCFWIDKWHASPLYATAHTVIALIKAGEYQLVEYSGSIEWLMNTQREDGSWGYFDRGTAEETAFAVLTLMHYYETMELIDKDIIHRGIEFLYRQKDLNVPHPELYIGKVLYAPIDVIEALILAAFTRYHLTIA